MADVEELETQVDEKSMKLTLQQACKVAQGFPIDSKYWKDKTILTERRTLRKYLEESIDASERKKLLEEIVHVLDK